MVLAIEEAKQRTDWLDIFINTIGWCEQLYFLKFFLLIKYVLTFCRLLHLLATLTAVGAIWAESSTAHSSPIIGHLVAAHT